MTREEKLWSMTAKTLQEVGLKLGLDIKNSDIKKGKAGIIEKILAAEAKESKDILNEKMTARKTKNEEPKLVPMSGIEKLADLKAEVSAKPERKRGAKIEYNGKAQNICAWAKELGVSANTLYSRIYILGWDVEKAFTYNGKKS